MNDAIAVVGTTIAALAAERQPQREPANGHAAPNDDEQLELPLLFESHATVAPPQLPLDEPTAVLPGTLFSASQLGERLRSFEATLSVLHHRQRQSWTPPESELHLKDKTI
jgi:hypothetical protein